MDQMKNTLSQKLYTLWNKVVEKKDIVIPVTTAIVGIAVGAVVTSVISNSMDTVPDFETLIDEA